MAQKFTEFLKGLIFGKEAGDIPYSAETEGAIYNKNNEKMKTHIQGADRELLTNDQTQTVENKTIDATSATGNNTVSMDSDDIVYDNGVSGLTATDVKAAIDELKTGLDNQNEASEISYDNSGSGMTATNVQAAIDENDGRLDTIEGATYVNSFNSRTGAVVPAASDYDADEIDYDNATSGLTATNAQAAIDEVEGRLDTAETNISTNASGISDHLADAVDAHDASAISNVPSGNLIATDVQAALNELQTDVDTRALDVDLTNHLNDAVDAHDASAISNVPSGNLVATDVQSALNELQTDVDTRATSANLTAHTGASSGVHGVTGSVVGTTDTQDLSGKTFTDAITLEELASTPSTPAAGDKKFYAKTDGKVYTLDDSGVETEVGAGSPILVAYLKYTVASGVNGGSSNTSFTQRPINTLEGDTSFISLNSNRFTLDPGKYKLQISCTFWDTLRSQAKLVQDPAGTPVDVASGMSVGSNDTYTSSAISMIECELDLASSTTFEIQDRCTNAVANGRGLEMGFGIDEVYLTGTIIKF